MLQNPGSDYPHKQNANSIEKILDDIKNCDGYSGIINNLTNLENELDEIIENKNKYDVNSFSNGFLLLVKNLSNPSKKNYQKEFSDEILTKILAIFHKFKQINKIDKAMDEEGNTALHHLAGIRFNESIKSRDDFFNIFKDLINEKNKDGQTALHKAFFEKNYLLAEILLAQGAQISYDDEGNSPFYFFSATKDSYPADKELINRLLEIEQRPSTTNDSSLGDLASPRHPGYRVQDIRKNFLLESNTKIKEIFHDYNIIKYAIRQKNLDNIYFWLEYGTEKKLIEKKLNYDILKFILEQKITNENESNIICEIFEKFYNELCLKSKASILNSDFKKSLLIEIARKGNLDSCNEEFLIRINKILFKEREETQKFLSLLSIFENPLKEIQKSLTDKEDPENFSEIESENLTETKDDNKNSLLHILLQNCSKETEYYEMQQYLRSFIDHKNEENKTPFIIAIERGLNKFCEGFLNDRKNIESIIKNYGDYMKCAINCGNIEIIKKLHNLKKENIQDSIYFDNAALSQALTSKNIKVIETLFQITENEYIFDPKRLFKQIIQTEDLDTFAVIIKQKSDLFESFFKQRVFKEIENYSPDDGKLLELILKSGITKDFSPTNKDILYAADAKKNNLNPLSYTLSLKKKYDVEFKILELLAIYGADTKTLEEKIKSQSPLNFESCFGRAKRKNYSKERYDCLIKIVNNKELYQKKFKSYKLSLIISDLYDNLLKVKQSNNTANSSQHPDSNESLETELLKNLKFMQVLQKIYHDESIDLSEKSKRSSLFKKSLNLGQASILSLKYLNAKSLKKFSFLEHLSDNQLILISKNLATKFLENPREIESFSKEFNKISNYTKKYGDQFSKKIITEREKNLISKMFRDKNETNKTLVDCKSIIKMIGHANINELESETSTIVEKVSTEFKKPATSVYSARVLRSLFTRFYPSDQTSIRGGGREVLV